MSKLAEISVRLHKESFCSIAQEIATKYRLKQSRDPVACHKPLEAEAQRKIELAKARIRQSRK